MNNTTIKFILRFGLLIVGILFCAIAYYLNPNSSFTFELIGIASVLLGLLIASRSPMLGFGGDMRTINGIGTTLYGKSEINPNDKSYIATKWYVFLGLPIVPLKSYRVIYKGSGKSVFFGTSTDYQMLSVPMNMSQILKTYALVYGFIVVLIAIIYFSI